MKFELSAQYLSKTTWELSFRLDSCWARRDQNVWEAPLGGDCLIFTCLDPPRRASKEIQDIVGDWEGNLTNIQIEARKRDTQVLS